MSLTREETWVPIKDWEGFYDVSDLGNVRSVARTVPKRNGSTQSVKGCVLKRFKNGNGYWAVSLNDAASGRKKIIQVHRLVANAFIPNPLNKPEVNHKDSDRTNAAVTNLEWVTSSENKQHAIAKGRFRHNRTYGEANGFSKLKEDEVQSIRRLLSTKMPATAIGREFGISETHVRHIRDGKVWGWLPLPDADAGAGK